MVMVFQLLGNRNTQISSQLHIIPAIIATQEVCKKKKKTKEKISLIENAIRL
jgi:hypothetical protein